MCINLQVAMIDVDDIIEDQSVEEINFTPAVFVNYQYYYYYVVQRRC